MESVTSPPGYVGRSATESDMTQLTWADLIVDDLTADQFKDWLAPWEPMIVGRVAPAFMTKFGSWFLRRPEGHVEILDVLSGTITQANASYDDFVRELNERWWQEIFLLSELILQLHDTGKIPAPGQCYALAPHPALGGPNPMNGDSVDPRFVTVMDVPLWQSLCAQMVGVVN
jgi:hypothetical protein